MMQLVKHLKARINCTLSQTLGHVVLKHQAKLFLFQQSFQLGIDTLTEFFIIYLGN